MPIENHDAETFVAFTDISGFKRLMQQSGTVEALDKFYSIGYRVLNEVNKADNPKIEWLFTSDCGVLFARYDNKERLHVNASKTLTQSHFDMFSLLSVKIY